MERYTESYTNGLDGTRIFYSVAGPDRLAEPDLVLCDGIGCDGFVWKYVARYFASRHRVIRWHYRGHGRSEVPDDLEHLTTGDLVRDLVAVMDAAGSSRAILAGHSVGVQVILETQHLFPDRVRALVPVCGSYGHPLDTFHDTPYLKNTFPYLYRAFTGFPEQAVRLWQYLLPSRLAWLTAFVAGEVNRSLIRWEDLQPYFDHLGKMDPEVFVKMLSDVAHHTAKPHLGEIDVPTLVVGAEADTFTPVWLSEEMARAIPGAEILIIPKGSHAAPIEQPELLELRMEKFFRERLGCYASSSSEAASEASSEASSSPAASSPAPPSGGTARRRRSASKAARASADNGKRPGASASAGKPHSRGKRSGAGRPSSSGGKGAAPPSEGPDGPSGGAPSEGVDTGPETSTARATGRAT